jgi:type VI secretion system secreted protein VgrG
MRTFIIAALLATAGRAAAQPALGASAPYAVLGSSGVANVATGTGTSHVIGDLGVSPGSSLTGFPPADVTGAVHLGDATAAGVRTAAHSAAAVLAGMACGSTLAGPLGGLTLSPGVYCITAGATLSGTLTLNAGGNPDAIFVFLIGTTLKVATYGTVTMTGSGQPCRVWWSVASTAEIGMGAAFKGNVLAAGAITTGSDSVVVGRLLAHDTGAVTLCREYTPLTRPGSVPLWTNPVCTVRNDLPTCGSTPVTLLGFQVE